MWSDFARSTKFTAGNSTTTRVEANWSQLKPSTGSGMRLDRTVGRLLDHLISILRELLTRKSGEQWTWLMRDVSTSSRTYAVNDIDRTCSCLFYSSYRLPCRHLMFVAQKIHRFAEMPTSSLPSRWSMSELIGFSGELEESVSALTSTADMMKLRGPRPGDTSALDTQEQATRSREEV
ncbi:hypothetical protein PHYSODRAFT_493119 [Phytophthora sojae]|uniref:SWIM-type domain-containing protein n=1 Tax=Phytophthora sojae (strain P6497) TaxID=1094619 RepID=G4Z5S1_PHYSP|nr:hypothetical protein PHYSODRAFT_493119 [Phytophthora sojae]EGZ19504.1 hypothetical protein PHYSODRAFT_493119 [Phytophthora sojae]|eukprot:XP_009522221.1 hypothetical protein PHYSODRAFT_493119 [Phytophthora sojae]